MRFGRLVFLAMLALAPAAYSLDNYAPPDNKTASSKDGKTSAPAAKDADAQDRVNRMESRMKERNREMDKEMKSEHKNGPGGRGRGR
jgi:hypothetical protein